MPKSQITNAELAALLRAISDYVEVSETPARIRLSVDVKITGRRLKLTSADLAENGVKAAKFAADLVEDIVNDYQGATGRTDGEEIKQSMIRFKGILTEQGF